MIIIFVVIVVAVGLEMNSAGAFIGVIVVVVVVVVALEFIELESYFGEAEVFGSHEISGRGQPRGASGAPLLGPEVQLGDKWREAAARQGWQDGHLLLLLSLFMLARPLDELQ